MASCNNRRRLLAGFVDMALRIVLADDHAAYRAYLRSLLEAQADIVVAAEAEDGLSAVRAAREHEPDIVVLDLAMPGLDGIEATRQIVRQRPSTKVLALSLHSDTKLVEAMSMAGVSGYMLKTDPLPDLLEALRAISAGRAYFSAALGRANGGCSTVSKRP